MLCNGLLKHVLWRFANVEASPQPYICKYQEDENHEETEEKAEAEDVPEEKMQHEEETMGADEEEMPEDWSHCRGFQLLLYIHWRSLRYSMNKLELNRKVCML